MERYTVFVGGTEVNDYYLTLEKANNLALQYIEDGYDSNDVFIGFYDMDDQGETLWA